MCRSLMSHVVISVLNGQVSKLWSTSAGSMTSHSWQLLLGVFLIFKRNNLAWVGNRLWSILHKKVCPTGSIPCRLAECQIDSQSASGLLVSALHGFNILLPDSSMSMRTLSSSSTLYQVPVFILLRLSRPSSFTSLMAEYISSGRKGWLPGLGISWLLRTFHW